MTNSKPPFSFVGIDHAALIVNGMDKALASYLEVLGRVRGYSYPALGMEQVWCGAALIALWDVSHPSAKQAVPSVAGGRNVDRVCTAIDWMYATALRAHLEKHGVAVVEEVKHGGARGGGLSYYDLDPFRNKLEQKGLAQYSDGRALVD